MRVFPGHGPKETLTLSLSLCEGRGDEGHRATAECSHWLGFDLPEGEGYKRLMA